MNQKIRTIFRNMIVAYTVMLVMLFIGMVSVISGYNRVAIVEESSLAIVNLIASDLSKKYFNMDNDRPVDDEYYESIVNETIRLTNIDDEITSIYIYHIISDDEKTYMVNIERNENNEAYNVRDFIGMHEEFSLELNRNEKKYYLTGQWDSQAYMELFSKYGSVISMVAPVFDENQKVIAFVGLDYDISNFINFMLQVVVIFGIMLGILGIIVSRWALIRAEHMIVDPILAIEEAAMKFTMSAHDGNSSQYHLPVNDSENELNLLSKSMNTMMMDIDDYIINIQKVTAEKERISVELDVATKIQASYLPNLFPPFPSHKEIDLYATMNPAKEVGGDFYDFFMLGEDKLVLVVADVSGKGVPAALFMMIGKTLIKNQAANTQSPAEIMTTVNNQLTEHNDASMFITIWLGIVDLKTGIVKACNAGHNPPVIQRAGGKFEIYKDKHGLVTGIMPDIRYKEYEFQLNYGDCVFNCTDGVQEATNKSKELFENSRMLEALNKEPAADTKTLLRNVKLSIDEFVADAPQFDDITMLAFRYLGKNK